MFSFLLRSLIFLSFTFLLPSLSLYFVPFTFLFSFLSSLLFPLLFLFSLLFVLVLPSFLYFSFVFPSVVFLETATFSANRQDGSLVESAFIFTLKMNVETRLNPRAI